MWWWRWWFVAMPISNALGEFGGEFAEVVARADAQQGGEQGHKGKVPREPIVIVIVVIVAAAAVIVRGNCPDKNRPEPLCVRGDGIDATMLLLPIATVDPQEIPIPALPANAGQ
jgi:hypothetical protein